MKLLDIIIVSLIPHPQSKTSWKHWPWDPPCLRQAENGRTSCTVNWVPCEWTMGTSAFLEFWVTFWGIHRLENGIKWTWRRLQGLEMVWIPRPAAIFWLKKGCPVRSMSGSHIYGLDRPYRLEPVHLKVKQRFKLRVSHGPGHFF